MSSSTNNTTTQESSKLNQLDRDFKAKASIEFTILILMIVYYIPPIIIYIKNRNNLIIKYRQPKNVIAAAILSTFNSMMTPILRYSKAPCFFNTFLVNPLILSFNILTFSRYVRTYYMHRLSIFKLKFSEKKNIRTNEKTDYSKTGSFRSKEIEKSSKDISEPVASMKSSSYTKQSSVSNDGTSNSFGIVDPILYFKKLNSIIDKRITYIIVVIPVAFVFIYSMVLTHVNFDDMKTSCVNEHKSVGFPKFVFNIIIIVTSIYMFYQAYIKQKWDRELKIEYTTFVVVDFICTIIMQLTINDLMGDDMMMYRVYIFQVYSGVIHLMCVIEPLIKIFFISKFTKNKGKLSEEEFLINLNNSAFKAQVMDIATHTFCIENVLFFDAHVDLMNIIINYYSKKSNNNKNGNTSSQVIESYSANANNSYTSTDILHKSTINPVLYKPFDNVFKPQFEQIYNLYIKEDGIASVNIKASTIRTIEDQMENENYSYLMFSPAAEEIGELLYNNIYPRMKNQ